VINIFSINTSLNLLLSLNNPLLSLGMQNASVAVLQKCLASLGYDLAHSETSPGNFDGIFGTGTRTSVVDFQEDQKIEPDGVAGGITFGRMKEDMPTYRDHLAKLRNIKPEEFRKKFDIAGVPTPKKLPNGIVWRPMGYVVAVLTQIDTLLGEGTIPRAVVDHFAYRVKIRPERNSSTQNPETSIEQTQFTPGHYIPGSKLYLGKDFTVRATLLHELFHAMRKSNRHFSSDNVVQLGKGRNLRNVKYPPGGKQMGNLVVLDLEKRGELLAITVTNIYRSELNPVSITPPHNKQMPFLRSDHNGFLSQKSLPRPDLFHLSPQISPHLKEFKKEQPELCRRIAASRAPFNPIRDL